MEVAEKLITENLDNWTSAVKAKSSTGRGASNKRELYGIQKLRELILELAVRGMLVQQDPEDEPARKLLNRIATERTRLIKEKVIKKQKALPEFSADDTPFKIPQGWEWARLNDASPMPLTDGDWIEKKDQDENGEIRLIQLADLGVNEFKDVSRKYVNSTTFARLKCTELKSEDVLIARLPSPIGRACVFPGLPDQAITAVDVAIHRPLGFMSNRYLVHSLNSLTSRIQVESYGKGATRFRIATGNLKSLFIPIPPLAEQHRIVAKVDELMALCDQLEQEQESSLDTHETLVATLLGALTTATADAGQFAEAWQRIQANFDTLFTTESSIDQLKQTILQLAVMGKLVPQDPEDEPAQQLKAQLIVTKDELLKNKAIRKQKVSDEPIDQEAMFPIPNEWKWIRLGNAISLLGGFAYMSGSYVPDSHNQIMRLGNVKNDRLLLEQKPAYITDQLADETSEYVISEGDILITMTGTKEKRDYAFTHAVQASDLQSRNLYLNQRVGAIKPVIRELVPLINVFLKSNFLLDLIFATATGTANQANIGASSILDLPFPLPPLAEQHRIVAKVDELMALCDQLKASLATAQATQLSLADSLVEQAIG